MKIIYLYIFLVSVFPLYAQVSSGGLEPDPSAQVDIVSGTRGMLIPRVELNTATDMAPIVNTGTLPRSLLVFHKALVNTSMPAGYYYWDNSQWNKVVTKSELDVLTANDGVVRTGNIFSLGGSLTNPVTINTNAQPFTITGTTNNVFSVAGNTLSVDAATNRVGIGTNAPVTVLDIRGTIGGTAFRLADTSEGVGKVLTSDAIGKASWQTPAVGTITNALSSSGNTITSDVNGTVATAPSVNSNALTVIGTGLTSTVNGVAGSVDLQSLVQGVDLSGSYWSKSGNSVTASDYLGTTNVLPLIIRTNDIERLRVLSDGKVGIGTTVPSATLHVVGASGSTLRIVDTKEALGKVLTSDSDGNASWETPAVGTITNALSSSGNTITSDVNGTVATAPSVNSNALTVIGTGLTSTVNGVAGSVDLESLVQGVDLSGSYWSKSGNSVTASDYLGTTNAFPLIIRTNNTERLRVLSDGKVGIGTTTPANLLTVNGGASIGYPTTVAPANGAIINGNLGIGIPAPLAKFDMRGTMKINSAFNIATSNNILDLIVGQDGGVYGNRVDNWGINMSTLTSVKPGPIARINFGDVSTAVAGGSRYLSFSVGSPLVELMYLTTQNGNFVGINTTEPTATLHVVGASGNTLRIVDTKQALGKVLTSDSDGNASWETPAGGVGTITNALSSSGNTITSDVNGTVDTALAVNSNALTVSGTSLTSTVNGVAGTMNLQSLVQSVNLSGNYWSRSGNSTTTSDFLGTTTAQPLIIRTNNTERLRVLSDGKVGIGTTVPSATLHVVGASGSTLRIVDTKQALGKVLTSDSNGNASWETPAGSTITNALSSVANTITSNVNGTVATAPAVNSNALTVSGTSLTSTVNGVAGTMNLQSLVQGVDLSGSYWRKSGNSTTTSDFLGTTTAQPLIIRTNNTERLRVLSDGKVGIGTGTPANQFTVAGNPNPVIHLHSTGNGSDVGGSLLFTESNETFGIKLRHSTGPGTIGVEGLYFQAAYGSGFKTIMILDQLNNRVGIGTTEPTADLSVNGTANKTGGGSWATFSDERMKKNIQPYTKGLNEIMKINPVTFQYNGKGGYLEDGKTYTGILAQEIEKILPGTVTTIKTKDFEDQREFNSSEIIYVLINAIKELQKQVEKLTIESE